MPEGTALTGELRAAVLDAGFELFGVTTADPLPAHPEVFAHRQPRELLPNARAVVVAGFCVSYEPRVRASEPGRPRGRFTPFGSRVFSQMADHFGSVAGTLLAARGFAVREGWQLPLKPAAVRAGLGRYGKHGVVLTPELGSLVMFAGLVTDAPLAARSESLRESACPAECTRCIEACPTGAIASPYHVDRAKCVTHWLWGNFAPVELRVAQKERLFGCGECLIACPLNARVATRRAYPVPTDPIDDSPELVALLGADERAYRAMVPTFPQQAGLHAMRGNAAVALGNLRDPAAVDALGTALHDDSALVRGYAAWALGRIGGERARALLDGALDFESDSDVNDEIGQALAACGRA